MKSYGGSIEKNVRIVKNLYSSERVLSSATLFILANARLEQGTWPTPPARLARRVSTRMDTSLFDYHLPEEQIAQHSVEPRDHSRLMLIDRKTGEWVHKKFFQIIDELQAGDVLVFNNTKVFRARLKGFVLREGNVVDPSPGQATFALVPSDTLTVSPDSTRPYIELFLLRAREGRRWEVLVKPGKKIKIGVCICIDGDLVGVVKEKQKDGTVVIEFDRQPEEVIAFANTHGEIPIPPYVKEQPQNIGQYQTVYAEKTGSVAAPTAGFHFTERLLDELKGKGVQCEFVTLHVGLGTFRPMKSQTLEEHEMHSEFVSLDAKTAERINQAKQEGRRVIAVGTTTVRTLEGIAKQNSQLSPEPVEGVTGFNGDINLFIKPGFDFKIIDGLITNFHLPKSTLLVLVSAFAGREHILAAYEEAVKQQYRFFSFGDAMFIR